MTRATRPPADPGDRDDLPRRRRATEAEAQALASALRLRIIRLCVGEELTNKEIAERLGRNPASVLHHVRRLVTTGFLEPLPARRGNRGAREVPYRSTGKSWRVDVTDAGPARLYGELLRAFLDELADAGGRLTDATRFTVRLRPERRQEMQRRIAELLDEYRAAPDPDGRWWSLFVGIHQDTRGTSRTPEP
ncbi:MAG TPA: helix-turn-helix domain-containing protein [Streptosporangiales bacterium]